MQHGKLYDEFGVYWSVSVLLHFRWKTPFLELTSLAVARDHCCRRGLAGQGPWSTVRPLENDSTH